MIGVARRSGRLKLGLRLGVGPLKITISGTPPTTGTVGQAYAFTPTTANGSGAKTFAVASGVLLGGLSFSTTTGAISGSPTVAGTISGLSISVTDSTGTAATTPVNVTIAAASSVVLEPNPAPQQKAAADTSNSGLLQADVSDNYVETDVPSYSTYKVGSNAAGTTYSYAQVQSGQVYLRNYVDNQQIRDLGSITLSSPLSGRIRISQKGSLVSIWTMVSGSLTKVAEVSLAASGGSYVSIGNPNFNNTVTGIIYGGDNIPLALGTTSLNGDLRIEGSLSYTGSPDTYQFQAETASSAVLIPWEDMDILTATKGSCTFRTRTPIPTSAKGSTIKYRIRQKNLTTVISSYISRAIAGKMLFGVNINFAGSFYANTPTADHISNDWRVAKFSGTSAPRDERNNPVWASITGTPAAYVIPPRTPGQRMRLSWSGDATVTLTGNGSSNASNLTAPQTVNGRTYRDFNFDFDLAKLVGTSTTGNPKDDNFLWMEVAPGSTKPYDFDCRKIDGSSVPYTTGYWDHEYVAELISFYGHQDYDWIRPMDLQMNAFNNDYTGNRVSQAGDKAARTGVSVPDLLDLYTLLGCWGRFNIQANFNEAATRAEARRAAQWAKARNKKVVAEWANEPWNTGQGAYNICAAAAAAQNIPGSDQYQKARRAHGYLHWLYMGWVAEEFAAEGVANLLVRMINIQCDNRGNQADVIEYWPGAIDRVDRIEVAPYAGANAAISPTSIALQGGGWDEDLYVSRVTAKFIENNNNALYHKNYAASISKDFGTYEGGREDTGDNAFARWFFGRQKCGDLTKAQLDHWDANVGGMYRWYLDNRYGQYGTRQHVGQPRVTTGGIPGSPTHDAWLTKIEAVKALP